jgi:hypothetical protein
MFAKLVFLLTAIVLVDPVYAIGGTIATYFALTGFTYAATAFAINMVVSAVITKAFFSPDQPGGLSGASQNPGNRLQVPPATDNKLPVVYGQAWLGGTVVDLSISSNNQELYYVMAICEVTDNGNDTITFGDVYWGGKKCTFASSTSPNVVSLTDESTGETDSSVNGKLQVFLYRNGSNTPVRGTQSAISVMQTAGLTYTWDDDKLMTNCAFAIIHLTYSTEANLTSLQQTKFQVTNSRFAPGDCFLDYLTNEVYGAAIPIAQIDTASLTALNTYSAGLMPYIDSDGFTRTQTRFRFDGVLDTNRAIMDNLQDMASCCDCLLRYNEITSQWGVIVQQPTYTIAMALDNSNLVSAVQISPFDIAASYNEIECKFPDSTNQDAFNSTTFSLSELAPQLLYENEPVNKESVTLPLVNNNVRAQYLAIRMLKASREDLQLQVSASFQGIQLEAGDIVTVTNANYGWVAKEFRVIKVTEDFASDGSITAKLSLTEFSAALYDDVSVTEFTPSPNTGIPDPLVFGAIPAPVVGAQFPTNVNPLFLVEITSSAQGVIQYAELWYSAFSNPTPAQLIFAGTTEVKPNGVPYDPNELMPPIGLANIPAGTWYFFSRMVNGLGTSGFSPASAAFVWRPTTFQYTDRYLSVAYADNATGTSNFSLSPTNRSYYGLFNTASPAVSSTPSDYTWYFAEPAFGTNIFLTYANRTGRRFSFDTGFAGYAAGTGSFVPTQASIFDPRLWSALPNGTNLIDLDKGTGQILETGTTTVGTGEIQVVNSPDGKVVAALKQYLDFGSGVFQKTVTGAAQITIDIYGRVIGFEEPDALYMTIANFTATSGQTVFSVTRASDYISGQCLVFSNGVLANTTEYTDTGGSTGTVTFGTGRAAGTSVTIISFRSVNATSGTYATFSRNTASLTNQSTYIPSGFTIASGYELVFLNGAVLNEFDYDIVGGNVTNFPNLTTGLLTVIQWTPNNLTTPTGDPINDFISAVIGQTSYTFNYSTDALNLYGNGVLLVNGSDYTSVSGGYVLSNTPTTTAYGLLQQTFSRTGAA